MKYSYNWLQSYFSKKLPPAKKLADLITEKAFEVEEVKKFKKDWVLDINILADRFGDSHSHLGMAREISALTGLNLKKENLKIKESKKETKSEIKIEIKDKKACPLYISKVIEGIKVGPSPKWLIERLEACGLQSINNIVDAANYVMLETGQPLHCFDLDKIADKKIVVRFAKDNEQIETLDNQKVKLNKSVLLITDLQKPLAIAGIKGGASSGVDKNTKNIAIESASFDSTLIRNTSLNISLSTDASTRFAKGVDPVFTEYSVYKLTSLIQELAGGLATKSTSHAGEVKTEQEKTIKFDHQRFEQFAGFKIPMAKITKILNSLQFRVLKKDKDTTLIGFPSWRSDIENEQNIYEEILRIVGYDNIPDQMPMGIITPPVKNESDTWQRKIRKVLTSLGYNEVYSYSFVSENDLNNFNLSTKESIQLENPISSEYEYLRPTQIINLLKVTDNNLKNFNEVKIFEIGKVFQKAPFGPVEESRLTGILATKDKKSNIFLRAKGSITNLFESLGVLGVEFIEPKETSPWLAKGRVADIKIDENVIGFLAQINPQTSQKYCDGYPVVVFEIDTKGIIKSAQEEKEFIPPSKYPSIIRDLSVLVDIPTRISEILSEINLIENKILADVDLFDIYEGESLEEENRKSLSFHFIFQANDRTLTSQEVDKVMERIRKKLEEKFAAEIR